MDGHTSGEGWVIAWTKLSTFPYCDITGLQVVKGKSESGEAPNRSCTDVRTYVHEASTYVPGGFGSATFTRLVGDHS